MELLEGLYRELAILGVVAFVLWSINVSDYVTIEVREYAARVEEYPRPDFLLCVSGIHRHIIAIHAYRFGQTACVP